MRSLDRMDRPLTAFTVGSNQLDSSDDPLAFVSMNGTGGIAFHPTFNELSPGRKCNCFVDYDCEATVCVCSVASAAPPTEKPDHTLCAGR